MHVTIRGHGSSGKYHLEGHVLESVCRAVEELHDLHAADSLGRHHLLVREGPIAALHQSLEVLSRDLFVAHDTRTGTNMPVRERMEGVTCADLFWLQVNGLLRGKGGKKIQTGKPSTSSPTKGLAISHASSSKLRFFQLLYLSDTSGMKWGTRRPPSCASPSNTACMGGNKRARKLRDPLSQSTSCIVRQVITAGCPANPSQL